MSYYFTIIGTKDNPIFEAEFGTSKSGGDGGSKFTDQQRHLNQFIAHAALDIVEEVQWLSGNMYLKHTDRHQNTHISTFITATNMKFMLLYLPPPPPATSSASKGSSSAASARQSTYGSSVGGIGGLTTSSYNPAAPAVEEAMKNFFLEVHDVWVKTLMNPFYSVNQPIRSPVFRAKVAGAARKYL